MNRAELNALKRSLIIYKKKPDPVRTRYEEKQTRQQIDARKYAKLKAHALEDIAVLDFETDPFDKEKKKEVFPFLAVLYADNFEPVVIWDNDFPSFVQKVIGKIKSLPRKYLIYAHNGGKFDFMFLLSQIKGAISFKGRGIMKAHIGNHELRDSLHIIPERLASYMKDDFKYSKLTKENREKYKDEIIKYCMADCRYLLDIVKGFNKRFGPKLSIGQAAMFEIRKHPEYKFERLSASMDEFMRRFFFGGRVECLAGKGKFIGDYKLYDVNSMYPAVMAHFRHPIGKQYMRRPGEPNAYTCFLEIECDNYGALVAKRLDENGVLETTTEVEHGIFHTSIHEYNMALKLNLIDNVKILWCIDNNKFTTFEKFVLPLYAEKAEKALILAQMKKDGYKGDEHDFLDVKKDYMFSKFLQNNGYGKFAQNPRKYKENYLCSPGDKPDEEGWPELPHYQCNEYWLYQKPAAGDKFNNVGTAASITGAARSVIMEAICHAEEALYCDTDSLVCKSVSGIEIDDTKLGAWKLEAEFEEFIVDGKKTYGGKFKDGIIPPKIRAKGVSDLSYKEIEDILNGKIITNTAKGVTLSKSIDPKTGRIRQYYMERRIKATARYKPNTGIKNYADNQPNWHSEWESALKAKR